MSETVSHDYTECTCPHCLHLRGRATLELLEFLGGLAGPVMRAGAGLPAELERSEAGRVEIDLENDEIRFPFQSSLRDT